MTLTKATLAEHLHETLGFNKVGAKDIVDNFFETICEALEKEDLVKISGLGNFVVRNKKERPGRNPLTGEVIPISARRVVTFKAGQKLKQKVKDKTAVKTEGIR